MPPTEVVMPQPWNGLRLPLLLALIWCTLMVALYMRSSREKDAHTNELALIQARTLYSQIVDTRAWNAAHGGVYVPESQYGEPNPWIPESHRTIALPNGKRMVLMNPAYMSRQIGERTSTHGSSFRITSHAPLRPENGSDLWETHALTRCIEGSREVFAFTRDEAGPRYRFMGALHTQKDCLTCHADNRVGDVRGGISVTLDAKPFLQAIRDQDNNLRWAFGLMGLTGVVGIGGGNALWRRKRLLAEERERMKSNFLANMSHDMRTPLTGILGMTELLEQPMNEAKRQETLRYLQLAGATLLEMVSDITDYAALDAGQIRLTDRPFDVRLALIRCLDLFHPQCRAKNLSLRLEVADDVPPLVHGDEFRLRQALGNLIGNSVKFTSKGGIRVRVTCPVDENTAQSGYTALRFAVEDTGVGIAPRDLHRIFERFERGSAPDEGYGGTGLGLSIAQDIALLMGGSLVVNSEPGTGSCFTLTLRFSPLPEGAAHCPREKPAYRSARARRSSGFNVLVGEDNAITTHYIDQALSRMGYEVRTAHDGQAVLQSLAEQDADLLILDMRMPIMDGLATARALRRLEHEEGRDPLPIVVLSASVSEEERRAFAVLDVEAHLLKPISARELNSVVASVLGSPAAPQSKPSPATPPAAPPDPGLAQKAQAVHNPPLAPIPAVEQEAMTPASLPVFDRAAALYDLDEDTALLHRLSALWLEEVEGQARLLLQAREQGDAATVHRVAHAWKNSAAVLHLRRLHSASAQLEKADPAQWDTLLPLVLQAEAEARSALRENI